MKTKATAIFFISLLVAAVAFAAGPYGDLSYSKRGIMDGNQVVTEFYNYGMIADWPSQPAGVWPKGTNHSYVDGVALIVAASTYDENGRLIHPMSTQYREFMDSDPETGDPMGWAPLPGYANPNQDAPAMSDDPASWPFTWPDRPGSWDGFWNGYFGKGVTNADLETYFVMDDAIDREYDFYPDENDRDRRGLGMEVNVRGFQWNHVLAEDCIFWHYGIENIATTDYDSTVFGMYIDWGVGGTDDSGDDAGSYDTQLDLAYAWDGNGVGTPGGWGPVGYTGFAFLESPGKSEDGVDNDEDGLVDERRDSGPGTKVFGPVGIYGDPKMHWSGDEDGDWDSFNDLNENGHWDEGEPLNDDLGEDGIGPADLGYTGPDAGEGDGMPTDGEPDFDKTDKDESDQIGLTAFVIFPVHFYELINEEQNWSVMTRIIEPTEDQLLGVNLGMYFFSGPFKLYHEGNTENVSSKERFSMALLFGNNKEDLFRNKQTVQAIYNANYNFAQPPLKPRLTAIPGNKKVTLHWDNSAENSYDRFLQEKDFEGYRIYRSTDPSFIDSKLVTDSYGNPTYRKPLAQYDLRDGRFGPHLVGVYGAHFDQGEDTGLRHSFIDTDVNNGVTYYYSVVSYDYGFIDGETIVDTLTASDGSDSLITRFVPNLGEDGQVLGIAPTECTSTIIGDVGGNVQLDVNTASVVPDAPAAGFILPKLEEGIEHLTGTSNSDIKINLLLADSLKNDNRYAVAFEDAETNGDFLHYPQKFYVINKTTDDTLFRSQDDVFGQFSPYVPMDPSFWIEDPVGARGRYFAEDPGADEVKYWHPNPVIVETPIVDGFSVSLVNNFIDYADDPEKDVDSTWTTIKSSTNYSMEMAIHPLLLNNTLQVPYTYEIRWADEIVDISTGALFNPNFDPKEVNFQVWNVTLDQPGEFIVDAQYADEHGELVLKEMWIAPKLEYPAQTWRTISTMGIKLEAPADIYDTTFVNGEIDHIDTTFVDKTLPGAGDVFGWAPPTPFSSNDTYEFTVNEGFLDKRLEKRQLSDIAVVPNPYVATASWEPRVNFIKGRGPRKIDFIHLPQKCTIRIYTLAGFLVDTLEHNAPLEDGSESWDLVSKDGMDIAFGVYIYHVDAPGVGEHVGKFAVIK